MRSRLRLLLGRLVLWALVPALEEFRFQPTRDAQGCYCRTRPGPAFLIVREPDPSCPVHGIALHADITGQPPGDRNGPPHVF